MIVDDLLSESKTSLITNTEHLFNAETRINDILYDTLSKKGRNWRQIIHIYSDCCNIPFGKYIFSHSIIQKEIVKYKRNLKKKVKTIKGKDILRSMRILKF